MIEEQAIVVGILGKNVEIRMERQSTCSHCELSPGCGTGAVGRLLGHRSKPLIIENTLKLKSGDHILLGIPNRSFLRASLLIYGMPVGLLVITALMVQMLSGGSEILVPIGACAGFLGGLFLSARLAGMGHAGQFNPRILQVNSEPIDQI